MIPVSVIITTYNEGQNLARCLCALKDFDEVIVVDSNSTDNTKEIAIAHGARVENFMWNGEYPKKRQYCLDNIKTKHDYIFFVDGDEEVTPELIDEIQALDFKTAGYFVKGKYIWRGKKLNHGLQNNKLVLFDRSKIEFPIIDDLDIDGMGEMEGHYQPVLKAEYVDRIESLSTPLLHFAYEDADGWLARHARYAKWEAEMITRNAYPRDPVFWREKLKVLFRNMPLRGLVAFSHSYLWKRGFLDGRAGYEFARSRAHYYNLVSNSLHHQ